MPQTNTAINDFLNYEFRNVAIPADSGNWYIDLSTSSIENDGSGSVIVSGNGYTQVVLAKNSTNWTEAVSGELTNSVSIVFPNVEGERSTGDWGTIVAIVLRSVQGGAVEYYQHLNPAIDADEGTQIIFGGGSLKFGRVAHYGE